MFLYLKLLLKLFIVIKKNKAYIDFNFPNKIATLIIKDEIAT